jgi:hypothetical protein
MDNGTEDGLDPAALEQVRRDLGELKSDTASAPDVPPDVTARVVAALRAESSVRSHAQRRPPLRRLQVLGLVVGLGAALAGVIVGASMLGREPAPTLAVGPTAEKITVARPAAGVPLPHSQIIDLLAQPPDFGPLTDPRRRASCLDGLGYSPGTTVLGARPLEMHGRPAMLLLLPGETAEDVVAAVVEPGCSSAHTGLLARSVIIRP